MNRALLCPPPLTSSSKTQPKLPEKASLGNEVDAVRETGAAVVMRRCVRAVPTEASAAAKLHSAARLKMWGIAENSAKFGACQRFAGKLSLRWKDWEGCGPSLGFTTALGIWLPSTSGVGYFSEYSGKLEGRFAGRSGRNGLGACPLPAGGRLSVGRSLPPQDRAHGLASCYELLRAKLTEAGAWWGRSVGMHGAVPALLPVCAGKKRKTMSGSAE